MIPQNVTATPITATSEAPVGPVRRVGRPWAAVALRRRRPGRGGRRAAPWRSCPSVDARAEVGADARRPTGPGRPQSRLSAPAHDRPWMPATVRSERRIGPAIGRRRRHRRRPRRPGARHARRARRHRVGRRGVGVPGRQRPARLAVPGGVAVPAARCPRRGPGGRRSWPSSCAGTAWRSPPWSSPCSSCVSERGVKAIVSRQRPGTSIGPDIELRGDVHLTGESFVSGHAVLVAALAGVVSPRTSPGAGRSSRGRSSAP